MKRKLNIGIAMALAATMATAYGTCYLNAVVCCLKANDSIGAHTFNDGNGCTGTVVWYAAEDCWKYDTYAATRGGRSGTSSVSGVYCEGVYVLGTTQAYKNPGSGPGGTGVGFQIIYSSPCNGSDFTDINALTHQQFWTTTSSEVADSGVCN